jgi:hypothetical protein
MVILGGLGSIPGVIVGAAIVQSLEIDVLQQLSLMLSSARQGIGVIPLIGIPWSEVPAQLRNAKEDMHCPCRKIGCRRPICRARYQRQARCWLAGNSPQLLSDSGRKDGLVSTTIRPTPFGPLQHNCCIAVGLRSFAEPYRDL